MNYCPLCLQGFLDYKGFHMCPKNEGYSVELVSLDNYREEIEALNSELEELREANDSK